MQFEISIIVSIGFILILCQIYLIVKLQFINDIMLSNILTPINKKKEKNPSAILSPCQSQIGYIKWNDGTIYYGTIQNNLPSSFGVAFYPNGKIYSGIWIEGEQHGEGLMRNNDGTFLLGAMNKYNKVSSEISQFETMEIIN